MNEATYEFEVNGVLFLIELKHIGYGEYRRRKVAYKLYRDGEILFEGNDLEHAHADPTGPEVVDDLNVLLIRYPGDGSGDGYEIFDTYTPEQMRFAKEDAEDLQTEIDFWLEDRENDPEV